MSKLKHVNSGNCGKCDQILNKYPGFHSELGRWFKSLQTALPEAHISWAGRGKADQELFYSQGTTRARYGQSAHNYNCAVDFFRLTQAGGAAFDSPWYKQVIGPLVLKEPWLRWYGVLEGKNDFYELPHVEVRDWRDLVAQGSLKLVEPA